MDNWRDVIRLEKRKEKSRVAVYLIVLIAIIAIVAMAFLYTKQEQASYAGCVSLLAAYEPSVKSMAFENITTGDSMLVLSDSTDAKVSMLLVNGSAIQCDLSMESDMAIAGSKVYRCEQGTYYYKTGQEGGFYYIATKAVPKDGVPFSRVKLFASKSMYNAYATDIQNSLTDCEQI